MKFGGEEKKTYRDAGSPIHSPNPSAPDASFFSPSLVADGVAAHGDLHLYSHLWEEEMRWRRPRRSRVREGLQGKDGIGEKSLRRARRKSVSK
jgi:hypothetical protein